MSAEDGRCQENETRKKCKGGSEGFHNAGSGLDFLCDGNRTLKDGGAGRKDPAVFSSARPEFPVYMLMPRTALRVDRELIPHLWMMGVIVACTAMLALGPQWIVHAGYRCELQALTGLRCPFCGMTRDFAAMLHGERPALNPCSWIAAVVVYGVYPAAVLVGWRRRRLNFFQGAAVKYGVMAALAAMLVLNNLH